MQKNNLADLSRDSLRQLLKEMKIPAFTGDQLFEWLYGKKVFDFGLMSNISQKNRTLFDENFEIRFPELVKESISSDRTRKYLYKANIGFVETAWIPEEDSATLCVSSQAGCKRQCDFCQTGKQGLQGQLSASEIVGQYMGLPEEQRNQVKRFVFMGMGEPFDNLNNVKTALTILTDEKGLSFGPKRITVSTVGILPGIEDFTENCRFPLALSLHNPFSEEREIIMPVEKPYPLEEIFRYLKETKAYDRKRRFSVEYILFKDFNDSLHHAKKLASLMEGIPKSRVNLLNYHDIPDTNLKGVSREKAEWFQNELKRRGVTATIRRSRGQDIEAACGLLSTKESNIPSSVNSGDDPA